MQSHLSPDDARTLYAAADAVARRLAWRLRLPHHEAEDFRQDLLKDLFRRFPAYDPDRGSLEAFVQVVLGNCASRIATRIGTERRARGGALLSLDLPLDDAVQPLRDTISEEGGLWAWLGQRAPDDANAGRDVTRVLALLPEADRQLCRCLMEHSVTTLARAGYGSRSGLYRRVADLRCVLTAYGLGPVWDDRAAA